MGKSLSTRKIFYFVTKCLIVSGLVIPLSLSFQGVAHAGLIQTIRDIFSPDSDLEGAMGSRRGGSSRDPCDLEPSSGITAPIYLSSIPTDRYAKQENSVFKLDFHLAKENVANERDDLLLDSNVSSETILSLVAFAPAVTDPLEDDDFKKPDKEEFLLAGKTTEEHPRLWVYVPFSSAEEPYAKLLFSLSDTEGNGPISPIEFSLPGEPGFVGIQLPRSQPGLQYGEVYEWSVRLRCHIGTSKSTLQTVVGLIQRTDEVGSLESSTQYESYIEREIWYDVVNHLISNKHQQMENWSALLSYFKLNHVSSDSVPILIN